MFHFPFTGLPPVLVLIIFIKNWKHGEPIAQKICKPRRHFVSRRTAYGNSYAYRKTSKIEK